MNNLSILRNRRPAKLEPGEVYAVFTSLAIGNVAPPEVYIADYQTGEIPAWTLREREEHSICCCLVFVDPSSTALEGLQVALRVISCPAKTLATGFFMWKPDAGLGPSPRTASMLHDLLHEAKLANNRAAKLPVQQEYVPMELWG